MKKLRDVTLFLSGNPNESTPSRLFVTYRIISGKALSDLRTLEINDPDTSVSFNDFLPNLYQEIKIAEGIE